MGMVVMSKRELNRLEVLARLDSDRLTAQAAAELMKMTPRLKGCAGRQGQLQLASRRRSQFEAS